MSTPPAPEPSKPTAPSQPSQAATKDTLIRVVALVILAAFALLVVAMFRILGAVETQWTRAVFLFSGVEAIAFSAAGFLFGREVNRQRADTAEETSKNLSEKTNDAVAKSAEAIANGRALRALIDAKLQAGPGLIAKEGGQPHLEELSTLAHELFP